MKIRAKAKLFLDVNLLKKINAIKTKETDSDVLISMGLGEIPSYQSFLIKCGNAYESFWNEAVSACPNVTNLLLNGNKIDVPGKVTGKLKKQSTQQIDHLFKIDNIYYYRESKCNLNFDSEKSPASIKKIILVSTLIAKKFKVSVDTINYGYFVPVVKHVPSKTKNKARSITNQDGVLDLIRIVGEDNLPFTAEEYFYYLNTTLKEAVKLKLKIASD